mmetsp:Transcript_89717/g.278714  ORF Transcript_89717/g.278714 Transcript_89717/m.278714 type:complete len:348 (-) Transcript_89717:46-1089(-)
MRQVQRGPARCASPAAPKQMSPTAKAMAATRSAADAGLGCSSAAPTASGRNGRKRLKTGRAATDVARHTKGAGDAAVVKAASGAAEENPERCSPALRGIQALLINLERRPDRRRALEALAAPHAWLGRALRRVPAVDGRDLAWPRLVGEGLFTVQARMQAQKAEDGGQPTINLENPEESSSHLTLGGCGCALSHRQAWQELADSEASWALVLEDDLVGICPDFDAHLDAVLGMLPRGWCVCYLGHHSPVPGDKKMLGPGERVQGILRVTADGWLAGLWCYLVSKEWARLALRQAVPFAAQVDAVLGIMAAESGRCFCLAPGQFLALSRASEVSRDTDVQTFPGAVGP